MERLKDHKHIPEVVEVVEVKKSLKVMWVLCRQER